MIRRPAGPVLLRHSRAAWGEDRAAALLAATTEALMLWDGELDYGELPDDIAVEARLACTSPTRSLVASAKAQKCGESCPRRPGASLAFAVAFRSA